MAKPTERELELRALREEALAAEEGRRERARLRAAHYAEAARAVAVTQTEGVSRNNGGIVTKRIASVTKSEDGEKRGPGRPPLLGTKMSDAERARRYRARKKAEGKP